MTIVAGAADAIVPVGSSARAYAAQIPRAEMTIFPGDVGHDVFLVDWTEAGRTTLPGLCINAPGVDRGAINADDGPRRSLLCTASALAPQVRQSARLATGGIPPTLAR